MCGLPGCVMYAKRTIFDLVLPRLLADVPVTADWLAGLGVGGLCLNCPECPFPQLRFWKRAGVNVQKGEQSRRALYKGETMELTHIDPAGNAVMVDVGEKPATRRTAVAEGFITMSPHCFAAIAAGRAKKGDVLGVAQVAGIMPPSTRRT